MEDVEDSGRMSLLLWLEASFYLTLLSQKIQFHCKNYF